MLLRTAVVAASVAQLAFAQKPSSRVLLEKALALFNGGSYQECFQILSPFVRENPQSAAARKLLGMDEYMLGRSDDAFRELQRAIDLAPDDADAFYYLGRLYFSTDNAPAALKSFERAAQLDPSSVRIHNQMGQTLEALGRQDEAEREYLNAIELNEAASKKSEWPLYNLGVLYFQDGRIDNAVLYFRRALVCNPGFPDAKIKLAIVLSQQGHSQEAERLLGQAVASDPLNAEGHYRLGLLLLKIGKPEQAQQELALFEKYRKR